jgi:hypothetical protein
MALTERVCGTCDKFIPIAEAKETNYGTILISPKVRKFKMNGIRYCSSECLNSTKNNQNLNTKKENDPLHWDFSPAYEEDDNKEGTIDL